MIKLILTGLGILCLLNISAYSIPVNKPIQRRRSTHDVDGNNDETACGPSRRNHGWGIIPMKSKQ